MVFAVTAKDASGARVNFRREAESQALLSVELRAEGMLILSVKEVREVHSPWSSLDPRWLLPMSGFDVEVGLRQLASMIRSDVTLLMALQTVEEQASRPRAWDAWRRVRESIFHGGSLADAFGAQSRRFGEIAVRLAEVGERSGELENALSRAADQLESRRNLRTVVLNALVYPVLTLLLAVAVSGYLVLVVIPKIGEFLSAGGVDLPPLTQALLDFSDWVRVNGLWILSCCGGATILWFALRLFEPGRESEDVLLLRLPVVGRIFRLSGTALFSRAMQIMTESGVTLLDALGTVSQLMVNRRFRRRVSAAREAVIRGSSLSNALAPAREFFPMLCRMAAVGEVTGSLAEAFGETARFHEMLLALAVKRLGMLMEPVMICVTGLIVGFVYIAFFMALFAIAGSN